MPYDSVVKNLTAQEILEGIKQQRHEILEQVYRQNFMVVEKFVTQNSGNMEDAKDVYQEAFIATWRNIQLEKFVPQNDQSFNAYLYQIAKNKWISKLRSADFKKVTALSKEVMAATLTEDDLNASKDHEQINLIKQVFAGIGPNCQQLLMRFYYKNQSLKTIASIMGWTEATAKNNKYRCLEKLRAILNKK